MTPGVRPPSPSTTKTLTSDAPAILSASASPAAKGMPWPDGPVLALKKQRLAGHLGVAGQAATVPEAQQVLPREGPAAVIGEGEARVAIQGVPRAHAPR